MKLVGLVHSIWDVAFPDDSQTTDGALTIYVCVAASGPATVTAEAPPGVGRAGPVADRQGPPGRQEHPRTRDGSDGGRLMLTLDAQGDGGSVVLEVVVDGDEWSLERP